MQMTVVDLQLDFVRELVRLTADEHGDVVGLGQGCHHGAATAGVKVTDGKHGCRSQEHFGGLRGWKGGGG